MARVAVIIPAYNAASYLAEAIDSVLAQTYQDWELIVVDDGSSDDTRSIVEKYQPVFAGKVRYIYQDNQGLPGARNTGIRSSSSEFIALLDADDTWLPERLQRGVAVMDLQPDVGLVHARIARIDARGNLLDKPVCNPKYLSGHIAHHIYTRRAHIMCPTVLLRSRCLWEVGEFDRYMRATEDRDLWFRIASRYPFAFIDEILAHYRLSPGSMSRDLDRMSTAQLYFIQKHRRGGLWGFVLAQQAIASVYRERAECLRSNSHHCLSIGNYFTALCHNPVDLLNWRGIFRAAGNFLISKTCNFSLRIRQPRRLGKSVR